MIKVAIVGVGNCASSLVQAVAAARAGVLSSSGVSHQKIGPYQIQDIEFSAAFDIDSRKIGCDLSEGILKSPNCTSIYYQPGFQNCPIHVGALEESVSEKMAHFFQISPRSLSQTKSDVVQKLKQNHTEVVVSYLPVGAQRASEFYAEASAEAGAAFVNCTPAQIANHPQILQLFQTQGLPLLGDDIKSHIGSTAIHLALLDLLHKKGLKLKNTYQINIGGNTDFLNMRDPACAIHKKKTKEASMREMLEKDVGLSVGPSDYIPHLNDHKVGFIQLEGEGLLGMKFSIDLKLQVEDSPNSAGVALNALRIAKLAMDRKMRGVIDAVCPWLFKDPPKHLSEEMIFSCFNEFLDPRVKDFKYATGDYSSPLSAR